MPEDVPFRKVLPWVAFLSLMFFMNYTGRSILGPLLVYIEQDLGFDHSQATGLLMYLSIGFSFCLIFSGFMPAYFKPRLVVAFSCAGMGGMLMLMAQSHNLFYLRATLAGTGIFAGFYFTSAFAAMGSVVSRKNWSKAIAMHEMGPALSFILAPLIAEAGMRLTGSWRGTLMIWGLSCLVVATLYASIIREGSQKTQPPSWNGLKALSKTPWSGFSAGASPAA